MQSATRREIIALGLTTAAIAAGSGLGSLGRVAAQQRLTQRDLLQFDTLGDVTLLYMADVHGQLVPLHLRESPINLAIDELKALSPDAAIKEFLARYNIPTDGPTAHALTAEDFAELAKVYGRLGGLDRAAAVIKAVRAERGEDKVLLLDGGDTLQGSLGAHRTKGQDMVDCFKLLRPGAMTCHWEFTYGEQRVNELKQTLGYPLLALNVRDTEWQEPVFEPYRIFEKGGTKIAVLGQAFPFTTVSNPAWLVPNWSFGIREDDIRINVERVRREGAEVVVLLSHNGFAIDRKLAGRVRGIDVILTAHSHDPLPEPVRVGNTLLIAAGSYGKFVARLDLDVRGGAIKDFRFRLIPLFADAIAPDPEVKATIERVRSPFATELARVVGRTDSLLYRRGQFDGPFDDVICAALMQERDAEIGLSPGFWWGTTVIPGSSITIEDIYNVTAITYPEACRRSITGEQIKQMLEEAADSVFNPDPYYRQGGDMIRCGGLRYTINVGKPSGDRISRLSLARTGEPIDQSKSYVVSSWACGTQGVEGPPVWEVLENYIRSKGVVRAPTQSAVTVATD